MKFGEAARLTMVKTMTGNTTAPQGPIRPRLVNRSTAASYCGLAAKTLANLHSSGEGPPTVSFRGRTMYRLDDLDSWIEASIGG